MNSAHNAVHMPAAQCVLNEFSCAAQLTSHQIEADTFVIGLWVLVVAGISLLLQYGFKVPVWRGVKWLFSLVSSRIVREDATSVIDVAGDDEPSWILSSDRSYPNVPAEIQGRIDRQSQIFDVWVYATNTSKGDNNPRYVAHVYVPRNILVARVYGSGTVLAEGNAGRAQRIPNFLETTFTVHAPDPVGTTTPLGILRILMPADEAREMTVEFLYNITYYPRETYPWDRLSKFSVALKPSSTS